jgi:hypothetical protein
MAPNKWLPEPTGTGSGCWLNTKKRVLTRGNTGAPEGIRTPNLLIRRSMRWVRNDPQRSLSGVEPCVMILVDGLMVDRVAVSVAVSLLIMWRTIPRSKLAKRHPI